LGSEGRLFCDCEVTITNMNKLMKHEKMTPIIKTIAEKAISCFPATGDVIQAYVDAGSLFMNKFISQKDKYKDIMDMLVDSQREEMNKKSGGFYIEQAYTLYRFRGFGCVMDRGSSFQFSPERGDIVVHGRNDAGDRNYYMVCDYTFSIGVRVYDYSDKLNPKIMDCPNVDALIRVLE